MATVVHMLRRLPPGHGLMLSDFERERVMEIVGAVAEASNVSVEDILGDCRKKFQARARHIAAQLCVELTDFSYPVLALALRRDHTSVLYAARKSKDMTKRDSAWTYIYERAKKALEG